MKVFLIFFVVMAVFVGTLPGQILIDEDFEQDDPDSQPRGLDYTFSPDDNTGLNGASVIDETSQVASSIAGQSLYLYDLSGDGEQGTPTHFRFSIADGENLSSVRLDFDFQRSFASGAEDEDTRIHVALGRVGDSLNNSDFRPFELRLLNNGSLVLNSIEGSVSLGSYDVDAANRMTILANSHDTNFLDYNLSNLGEGTLNPNTLHVFIDGFKLGEFDFHVTPDPENAPQIKFDEEDNDLGQLAFYQDSKRQGGMVFDNILVSSLSTAVAPPNAPTELSVTSFGSLAASIEWIDNADNELNFIVQRRSSSDDLFEVVATLAEDVTSFTDETLLPETEYTYRVFADNGFLSEPSNELTFTTEIQLQPLILETTFPDFTVSGLAFDLSVSAVGLEPLAFQWYQGESGDVSNPIEGAIDAALNLKPGPGQASFWARISNAEGSVDSETFLIDPYLSTVRRVEDDESLEQAIALSLPGDTILMAEGIWQDTVIEFEATGLSDAPITLRAEIPGKTILTGESRLEIGGEWLVVDGLVFTGPYSGNDDEVIQFRANGVEATDSRLTNVSLFDYVPLNGDSTDWVSLYGERNRVDHCYFTGHDVNGVTLVVWLDGEPDDHLIDHNHFANRIDGNENGWETIRIGTSETSMTSSRTVVERNLFTRVDGEIEIISNKSGDNVYRYNTFEECRGTLTLRHGDRCLVEGNYFLGGFLSETGGVRVIGRDHVVINNYFQGTTGRDGAAITVYAGVPNSELNEYFQADNALIAFNTFYDISGPYLDIGTGFGTRDRAILPQNVTVANNILHAGSRSSGVFVSGINPGEQTWIGNLVFGREMGSNLVSGYTEIDPKLIVDSFGVARLALDSPALDASLGSFSQVSMDIDGQTRDNLPDVGADEVSTFPMRFNGPMTPSQTGPSYLDANRQFLDSDSRMTNQSARGRITSGDGILISGFVVGGSGTSRILIRGIGPSLEQQGVSGAASDVMISVFDAQGNLVAENDDWGQSADFLAISQAANAIGAFALSPDSRDAAVLLDLGQGSYGILLGGSSGETGIGLIEIYDLDFSQ